MGFCMQVYPEEEDSSERYDSLAYTAVGWRLLGMKSVDQGGLGGQNLQKINRRVARLSFEVLANVTEVLLGQSTPYIIREAIVHRRAWRYRAEIPDDGFLGSQRV
ncbi:hypothetical protein BDZ89DRAFT_1060757 [Hymenopellis radicata]|nr:hypothetical protein BDZ89DRAFT_1060757 [Hymenopellis radicata]